VASATPDTLEEWTEQQWIDWSTHENPDVPWLTPELKARVYDFQVVLKSRFPSLHDRYVRTWGKRIARVLASRRWERGDYTNPRLLKTVRRWAAIAPDDLQAYGHLRPAEPA
jgi:hypothetical protein